MFFITSACINCVLTGGKLVQKIVVDGVGKNWSDQISASEAPGLLPAELWNCHLSRARVRSYL